MNTHFKSFLLPGLLFCSIFSACRSSLQPEKLYGKWNYIKVYKPEANPPDSVSTMELQEMKPYIEFAKPDKLRIIWGGKVLSQGTFIIDADNIRFREVFDDGQSRQFPFYVSKLTEKELVFETVGKDGSKVTAVKEAR